jgi:hypothetical protein
VAKNEQPRAQPVQRKIFPNPQFRYHHTPPTAPLGRFGGGWQHVLGFKAGRLSLKRGTIIVELVWFYVKTWWG